MSLRPRHGTACCLATACLLLLAGCDRGFFRVTGALASDGGPLGRWSERPQGCSRDPWDVRPAAGPPAMLSFVWEDTFDNGQLVDAPARSEAPDAPLRLDLSSAGGVVKGRLETAKVHDVRLDRSVCRRLELSTSEQPANYAGGRPALRGTVRLDCQVQASHVTADLTFARCEY